MGCEKWRRAFLPWELHCKSHTGVILVTRFPLRRQTHRDDVVQIATAAVREREIERQLQAVAREWADASFKLALVRDVVRTPPPHFLASLRDRVNILDIRCE